MKHWIISCFAVCIAMIFSSCNSSSAQFMPTPSMILATSQNTSSSSSTSIPTITAAVTETPTFVPTKTQTPKPTQTLAQNEREQAEAEIKQLFQNNDVCSSPCYLGVIPGKTTTAELRDIFARWGIELHVSSQHAPSFYIEYLFKSGYNLNAEFLMKDDVVESVGFTVNQDEQHEWAAYSPAALLDRHGVPTRVSFWIGSIHEPSSTPLKGEYYMIMSYDELELHIEYGDVGIQLGETATVCPRKDKYGYSRVWLGKYPDFLPKPHETYIEEAASMTPQKFYDYVLSGPGACFYLDQSKVAHL